MDEKQQILHANIWIRSKWVDQSLKWHPEDFHNITFTVLPAKDIWIPDFAYVNEVSQIYKAEYFDLFGVIIWYNGTVLWTPGGQVSLNCPMNVRMFPFDTQTCPLVLSSWMYVSDRVVFNLVDQKFVKYEVSGDGIWAVVETSGKGVLEDYPSGKFSQINFMITLKRKSLYYVLYVMAPTLILGVLNLFLFILPPASGEKVQLGITIILSYFIFLLPVAEHLPQTSDNIPLFALYQCSVILLSALSLVCSIIVLYVQTNHSQQPVPNCLRTILFALFPKQMGKTDMELAKLVASSKHEKESNPIHTIIKDPHSMKKLRKLTLLIIMKKLPMYFFINGIW